MQRVIWATSSLLDAAAAGVARRQRQTEEDGARRMSRFERNTKPTQANNSTFAVDAARPALEAIVFRQLWAEAETFDQCI